MKLSIVRVKLTLKGPILTAATNPGSIGVDSPFARSSNGKLYFPGTLVKGKLRQAWDELASLVPDKLPAADVRERWLGAQAGNREREETEGFVGTPDRYEPIRGQATFTDFVDHATPAAIPLRTRIRIDEDRRAAGEGMMQILESPYASGEEAVFEGEIRLLGEAGPKRLAAAVDLGLRAIPSFGAGRGIGFGRLVSVSVTAEEAQPSSTDESDGMTPSTLSLTLTAEEPLCLALPQAAGNVFRTSDLIPGSAIKGAVAGMIQLGGEKGEFDQLAGFLSHMRILAARPIAVSSNAISSPAPHSFAQFGDKWRDLALASSARVLNCRPPAFMPDWKNGGPPHFSDPEIKHELRVRTEIDRSKRRAKDERLFAYESLIPSSKWVWRTNIYLHLVPDQHRSAVLNELKSLLRFGLLNVGKTKALLKVVFSNELPYQYPSRVDDSAHESAQPVVLQLNSPALIGSGGEWQLLSTPEQVHELYARYFAEISGGSLELVRHFARQDFSGGHYFHRRFQRRPQYQPWMLTLPGAVFVFAMEDRKRATECLEDWISSGLPLSAATKTENELGSDRWTWWQRCPYVRENGFGEVGVNVHLNWRNDWLT